MEIIAAVVIGVVMFFAGRVSPKRGALPVVTSESRRQALCDHQGTWLRFVVPAVGDPYWKCDACGGDSGEPVLHGDKEYMTPWVRADRAAKRREDGEPIYADLERDARKKAEREVQK